MGTYESGHYQFNRECQIAVRNVILAEEVHRKNYSEASTSNSVFNVDNRGRSSKRNSNKGNGNRDKSRGKLKNGRNLQYCNCGKTSHLKKNCKAPRKNEDKNNDAANIVTDEVRDALILSVDDSCDS